MNRQLVSLLFLSFCSVIISGQNIQHNFELCSIDSVAGEYLEFCAIYNSGQDSRDTSVLADIARFADSLGYLDLHNAKFLSAQQFYELSSEIWKTLDSKKEQGFSLFYLGRVHYRLGNIFESFQYLNASHFLAKEHRYTQLEAQGHLYLSWNYWRIGQCDQALLEIYKFKSFLDAGLEDRSELTAYYNGLAKFEFCKGNMSECFEFADSAIYFARIYMDRRLESVAMSNKASYLDEYGGSLDEKLLLMQGALKINEELNDKEQLGSNLGILADVYWKQGLYKKSLENGLKALEIASEIKDKPRIHIAHNICRRAYVGLEDYFNAYQHEKDARLISEKIYGLNNLERIFELEKDKAEAMHNQQLAQVALEKELTTNKISQERHLYALILGLMTILLLAGIWNWRIYKSNKEKETRLLKEVLENEVRKFELQSLRALMNPHFIFNSLNSIKGYIVRSEPRLAADYLNKFSHLIRLILANSQRSTISLKEELEALEIYIILEGLRLEDQFSYTISVEEGLNIDEILVAPMIIQPYVENAIWHGLMNLEGTKELQIQIRRNIQSIEIVIRDNGVGRKKAKITNSRSGIKKTSYGMKITEKRIKFSQKHNHVQVRDLIGDSDEGKGTEVIIQLNNYNND